MMLGVSIASPSKKRRIIGSQRIKRDMMQSFFDLGTLEKSPTMDVTVPATKNGNPKIRDRNMPSGS